MENGLENKLLKMYINSSPNVEMVVRNGSRVALRSLSMFY